MAVPEPLTSPLRSVRASLPASGNRGRLTVCRRVLLGLVTLLVILGVGVESFGPGQATAASGGPEMRLAVRSGAVCVDEVCAVPSGEMFTLAVEVVEGPPDGYVGAQSFVDFGSSLSYHATMALADEILWPECDTAIAVRSQLSAASVTHGCLSGLSASRPVSFYEGDLVVLAFSCSVEASSTVVRLLPFGDPFAATSGTKFIVGTGETVAAKVGELTVECLAPPTPTPTPTSTPGPSPSSFVGDANCDGTVNALDAALLLQLGADLIPAVPCPNRADANQDGDLNALDAALMLQFSAGLIGRLPP